jgi:acyl carrier protein
MTNEAVAQKIHELLARKLSIEQSKITGETRLSEDLGLDSFGGVEVMFEIEEAFELKISDSDIGQVRTVNDIVTYVVDWQKKVATQTSATASAPPAPAPDADAKPPA